MDFKLTMTDFKKVKKKTRFLFIHRPIISKEKK